jgi:hypothetical protein
MGIPTLVTDLLGIRSEVRWFLSPATEVSGQFGLVLLGHLSSKLIMVFLVTLPILGQLFLVILPVTPGYLLILHLLRLH